MKMENLLMSRGWEKEKRLLRRRRSTTWIFHGFGNDRFAVGNGSAKRPKGWWRRSLWGKVWWKAGA